MNKQEFLNYIIDYAICTGWEDCNGKRSDQSVVYKLVFNLSY